MSNKSESDSILDKAGCTYKGLQTITMGYGINAGNLGITGSRVEALLVDATTHDRLLDVSEEADLNKPARLNAPCIAGVLLLQKQLLKMGVQLFWMVLPWMWMLFIKQQLPLPSLPQPVLFLGIDQER